MPFLRQEPDNTLGETLGNLGSALGNALNPMNQIRANDMLAQMRQRQWEIQQQQRNDAANQNAAKVFRNANPLGMDDASKEAAAVAISQGHYDPSQWVGATTGLAKQRAAQAVSDAIDTDPEMQNWDPADKLAAKQAAIGGTPLPDIKKGHSDAGFTITKNNAITGAAATARKTAETMPNATPEAGPLAGAETYTDPAKAEELISRGRVRSTPTPTTPAELDTLSADTQAAGYGRPPLGTALTPSLQPLADADAAARGGEAERQKKVGELVGGGIAPSGQFLPFGLPGSPTNPLGAPPAAAAPAQTPPPDVVLPNSANPSAQPTPVVRPVATPDMPAATVVGETAPEATQRTAVDTANRTQLQDAVDAGVAGKKMMVILDRLNTLADLASTGGSSQIPTWVDGWLRDHNLVMTDRQGILAEMKSEFNAQIPELRKDMGVKFEAGPELSAQGKMIGDPSLPAQVLKGIFARQAAIAQMGIQRRELAQRALYPGQANPLSVPDYYKEEAKIYDNLGAEMQRQLKDYGAYTPQSLAPPPPPVQLNAGSGSNAFHSLFRWLDGGQTQPTQTQPPPQGPTEQWDVDANGHPVRVR